MHTFRVRTSPRGKVYASAPTESFIGDPPERAVVFLLLVFAGETEQRRFKRLAPSIHEHLLSYDWGLVGVVFHLCSFSPYAV